MGATATGVPWRALSSRSITSYIRFRDLNTDALEPLPKRVKWLELATRKARWFHGLAAFEKRCGFAHDIFILDKISKILGWTIPLDSSVGYSC